MAMVAETGYRQVQQRELPLPKAYLTTAGFECPTCLQQIPVLSPSVALRNQQVL